MAGTISFYVLPRGLRGGTKRDTIPEISQNRGKDGAGMEQERSSLFHIINAEHQFNYENGITLTYVEPGLTRGVLRAGPDSVNPEGHIHGGAIATLADTVAGCCACSTGGDCVTSSSTLEYLRPATGNLFCQAVPKKLGRHLSVIQVTITDTAEKTVATGTFTFFMTEPGQE